MMNSSSVLNRTSIFLLESIGNTLWGFKPNLMTHFVEQHGPVKSVAWFAGNMPKYEKILKAWGPIRTHLLATVISTINGCRYCSMGHATAFQLHYLKQHDSLFPLDENEMFELRSLPIDRAIQQWENALLEAGLSEEILPLRRMVDLFKGMSPTEAEEDKFLVHLIQMFATLNQCGIQSLAEVDQVHDPINRDLGLWERYTELRLEPSEEWELEQRVEDEAIAKEASPAFV